MVHLKSVLRHFVYVYDTQMTAQFLIDAFPVRTRTKKIYVYITFAVRVRTSHRSHSSSDRTSMHTAADRHYIIAAVLVHAIATVYYYATHFVVRYIILVQRLYLDITILFISLRVVCSCRRCPTASTPCSNTLLTI